jgi:hypothetical protein
LSNWREKEADLLLSWREQVFEREVVMQKKQKWQTRGGKLVVSRLKNGRVQVAYELRHGETIADGDRVVRVTRLTRLSVTSPVTEGN